MRLYLAGEGWKALQVARAKSILISAYAHMKLDSLFIKLLKQTPRIILDSGAFTFLATALGLGGKKNVGLADIDFDDYLRRYIECVKGLRRVGGRPWVIELDIDRVVGYPWVHKQRNELIKHGLGDKLVNVWHSTADWDYWLFLLREARRPGRSRYVAIEGPVPGTSDLDYTKFLREAYSQGVLVHAFKQTSAPTLYAHPFYSVDSTSWLSTVKYGHTPMRTTAGTLVSTTPEAGSASFRHAFRARYRTTVESKAYLDVLLPTIAMYERLEADVTRFWEARGVHWDRLEDRS